MSKKSLWVSILTICLLIMMILPVYASKLDDAQKEKEQIEQQLKQKQQEEKLATSKYQQLGNELAKLNSQLTKAQDELDRLNTSIFRQEQKIQEQQAQVEKKAQEIQETELYLEEQTVHLENRLRAMYLNGAVSYLDVLFSSSGFVDFVSRFNFLRSIIESDVELVTEVKTAREKLEADRIFLETELAAQVARQQQLELARTQAEADGQKIAQMVSRQQALRNEQKQNIATIQDRIDELEQEEAELKALIKRLEELARQEQGLPPSVFQWPVPGFTNIVSGFGNRFHPIYKEWRLHSGIDIAIPYSYHPGNSNYPAYIVAAASGTVGVGNSGNIGWGKYVIIVHSGGYATVYAHMHHVLVSDGQKVTAGQKIGTVGSTGASTGPHLHFEVRVNGTPTNPVNYKYLH